MIGFFLILAICRQIKAVDYTNICKVAKSNESSARLPIFRLETYDDGEMLSL